MIARVQRRTLQRVLAAASALGFLLAASSARAQNPFGQLLEAIGGALGAGDDAVPIIGARSSRRTDLESIQVDADFENQFTPILRKHVTPELHYLRKVCQPSETEFARIHGHAQMTVARISKFYETLETAGETPHLWPRPRKLITDEFGKIIGDVLTVAAADRYQDELLGREQTQRNAAIGVMLFEMNKHLSLAPEQIDTIGEELRQNWEPEWLRSLSMLHFVSYMPLPKAKVIRSHLSDSQKHLWSTRTDHGAVNFGWQMELAGPTLQGVVITGLPEIDLVASDSDTGTAAASTPDPDVAAQYEATLQEATLQEIGDDRAKDASGKETPANQPRETDISAPDSADAVGESAHEAE